jgi:hypothetical protein
VCSYRLWTVPKAAVAVPCHLPAWKGDEAGRNEHTNNDPRATPINTDKWLNCFQSSQRNGYIQMLTMAKHELHPEQVVRSRRLDARCTRWWHSAEEENRVYLDHLNRISCGRSRSTYAIILSRNITSKSAERSFADHDSQQYQPTAVLTHVENLDR